MLPIKETVWAADNKTLGRNTFDNFGNERIICIPIGTEAMDIAVVGIFYLKKLSLKVWVLCTYLTCRSVALINT